MNKPLQLLKSGLLLFACWLASFVIVFFFPMTYQRMGPAMCLVFGICSIGACVCIYGDFSLKLASRMRSIDERRQDVVNSNFGLWLGFAPTAINYIFVIILYLSKFGVISYDFYPVYKTLTFYFMPITYLFAPNKAVNVNGVVESVAVAAKDVPTVGMVIITILPLVFIATTYIAFKIGYDKIDVKERFLYGKRR